jgi:hypothetical protein
MRHYVHIISTIAILFSLLWSCGTSSSKLENTNLQRKYLGSVYLPDTLTRINPVAEGDLTPFNLRCKIITFIRDGTCGGCFAEIILFQNTLDSLNQIDNTRFSYLFIFKPNDPAQISYYINTLGLKGNIYWDVEEVFEHQVKDHFPNNVFITNSVDEIVGQFLLSKNNIHQIAKFVTALTVE